MRRIVLISRREEFSGKLHFLKKFASISRIIPTTKNSLRTIELSPTKREKESGQKGERERDVEFKREKFDIKISFDGAYALRITC